MYLGFRLGNLTRRCGRRLFRGIVHQYRILLLSTVLLLGTNLSDQAMTMVVRINQSYRQTYDHINKRTFNTGERKKINTSSIAVSKRVKSTKVFADGAIPPKLSR